MHLLIDSRQDYLTPKEARVVYELAQGKSKKMVAKDLNVSPSTIKTHVDSVLVKFECHSVTHAVFLAFERGFFKFIPCVLVVCVFFNGFVDEDMKQPMRMPVRVAMRRPQERLGRAFS